MKEGHVEFKKLIKNPFKYRMFLLANVPMAFLAGIKLIEFNDAKTVVSIPFKFLTKNPFKSIYFACLAMAAELSQGIIAMSWCYHSDPPVSMLPVKMEADFKKKATGMIYFECAEVSRFKTVVEESIANGEASQIRAESIGRDEKGDEVATFYFTWSFKVKRK